MGRTSPTARQSIDRICDLLEKMGSLMNETDIDILKTLILKGRKRSAEISYSLIDPEYGFIIAILLDMQKQIQSIVR